MKRLYIYIFLLCIPVVQATATEPFLAQSLEEITVTIWVHGTSFVPMGICPKLLYQLPGLHSATNYDHKYHKRAIAELLCATDPAHYTIENFYFFGWNGKLSFKEREISAQNLYESLIQLLAYYKQERNIVPKIRIITQSHGGNVVLNLAKVQTLENPLYIDELILLCCPVQLKTKHYIQAECFKKVYVFYSNHDLVQILDPQGAYKDNESKKTFSERRFHPHNNVLQASVKINNRSPTHIDFRRKQFVQHLPALCKAIEQFYSSVDPDLSIYERSINIQTHEDTAHFDQKLLYIPEKA